jgi:hypothetical protein
METKKAFLIALILLLTLLQSPGFVPRVLSDSYSGSYQLLQNANENTVYRLNIAVSQSLQDYYTEKSHRMNSESDFAKFVTPYTLQSIADCLREMYSDDEDYANAALMIVHQIPYEVTVPSKYPVETIVDNKGDCDLLSYVAASILKACGLDVVLFYYESEAHMNIGVNLSHVPNDARGETFYVTNNNIHYYVAECTGGDWQNGWRVGECPDKLKQASVQVFTLENSEQSAPGQVSASYRTLMMPTISLTTSTTFLVQGNLVTLSGQLSPVLQNETVLIYVKANSMPWTELATVTTDTSGRFTCAWIPDGGIDYVRANWSGNDDYAGADSQTQTLTVLSTFFVVLLGVTLVLVVVGTIVFLISRKPVQEVPTPQPLEVSS